MVSFTNYYNAISIERLPSKTKIGKYDTLIILLYVNPRSPLSYKDISFSIKTQTQKKKQVQLQ